MPQPLPNWTLGSSSKFLFCIISFSFPKLLNLTTLVSFFFFFSFHQDFWLLLTLGMSDPLDHLPPWGRTSAAPLPLVGHLWSFSLLMVLLKSVVRLPSWRRQVWVGIPGGIPRPPTPHLPRVSVLPARPSPGSSS